MSFFTPVETLYDSPLQSVKPYLRWMTALFRGIIRFVFKICFRYESEGLDNIAKAAKDKHAVIAANHQSFADPLFILIFTNFNCRFLARSSLFEKNWFFTQLLASMGAFPVKRNSPDRLAIRRAVASLKRGEFLGIFPEGTRRLDSNQVMVNHAGGTLIATLANVPIIPAAIIGADKIRPKGTLLLHFPKVIVRFGQPVDPSDYSDVPKNERMQAIMDEVMLRVECLKQGGNQ